MKRKRVRVVAKVDFEALHAWPTCPFDDVSFLRVPHRHRFYVTVKKDVVEDRGIEFIMLQREVQAFVNNNYAGRDLGPTSCEVMANQILDSFQASFVSVYEDNENGSEVEVENV